MGKRYNRDPYIGTSESQTEALYNRDHTFTEASRLSVSVAWNFHNREPKDLRECVRMVLAAYADEVPTRLSEGFASIGEGGTPKMHPRMEAYLDDPDEAGLLRPDPETGERPAIDYYKTPFRAALAKMHGRPLHRELVERIAIRGERPIAAAMSIGVPFEFAHLVAEDTLRGFLRSLTDVKVAVAKRDTAA